jgi:hypothetical protein
MNGTSVDRLRARTVVRRVSEAFRNREGLLTNVDDLVENQLPSGVGKRSREHALFLFYVVPNDHGVKSSRLYTRAKALFCARPLLFEPLEILGEFNGPDDDRLVEATGVALGTRYPKETAKGWYRNTVRLVDEYDADPRRLFTSSSDATVLLRHIQGFRGYGPKTGGMLLRALVGLGFAAVNRLGQVALPVDIHDSRISFFTGILTCSDGDAPEDGDYYRFVPVVQQVLLEACNTLRISWLDVDRALWLIGSKGCAVRDCGRCPIADLCRATSGFGGAGIQEQLSL